MFKKLAKEWESFYKEHTGSKDIDERSDKGGADWESLCVGWCLAKGVSVDDAFAFYRAMIDKGLY